MIPLSKELLNHWHGTRTNSKWNEPSMHCQAENLSPYVRHGRMFHVIQVYPGCWSPPFKKTIEYYASFTHCHIVLYNDTRVYDSVNTWTRTNTYVYNCIYIYILIYMYIRRPLVAVRGSAPRKLLQKIVVERWGT